MAQQQAAPPVEPDLSKRAIWAIFGGLLLGMLLAALDQTIVSTALPTIVSDLGGVEHLSWVVTAYLLASTVATPLWGKLGDQYGRKKLFTAVHRHLPRRLRARAARRRTCPSSSPSAPSRASAAAG